MTSTVPVVDKPTATFIVGDDPQVYLKVVEDNGNLFCKVTSLDHSDTAGDIDAVFLNFTDPSIIGTIGTWAPDSSNIEMVDDGVNSLYDGTELKGDYDAKIEISDSGTNVDGDVSETAFTFWSDDRPLTLEDLDLKSVTVVVDTAQGDGTALTYNDHVDVENAWDDYVYGDWHPDGEGGWVYTGGDTPAVDDTTKDFTIEGDVNVKVTMTELENGDMKVDLDVVGDDGNIGDLRGLFFNMSDDSLADDLTVTGDDVTDSKFNDDHVGRLHGGVKLTGDIKHEFGKFDGGVAFGSKDSTGEDDIQHTSFTLSHGDQPLTFEDFDNQNFVIRLDSVGEDGGDRSDKAVILGQADLGDEDSSAQYDLGQDAPADETDDTDPTDDPDHNTNDDGSDGDDKGHDDNGHGKGHDDHGKGRDDNGKGHDDNGKGHDDHGKGHDDNGKGHDDNGKGHDDNGKGHDSKGHDDHAQGADGHGSGPAFLGNGAGDHGHADHGHGDHGQGSDGPSNEHDQHGNQHDNDDDEDDPTCDGIDWDTWLF